MKSYENVYVSHHAHHYTLLVNCLSTSTQILDKMLEKRLVVDWWWVGRKHNTGNGW